MENNNLKNQIEDYLWPIVDEQELEDRIDQLVSYINKIMENHPYCNPNNKIIITDVTI